MYSERFVARHCVELNGKFHMYHQIVEIFLLKSEVQFEKQNYSVGSDLELETSLISYALQFSLWTDFHRFLFHWGGRILVKGEQPGCIVQASLYGCLKHLE